MMKIGSEKGTRKIFSVEKCTSEATSVNMARFARIYFHSLLHARYDTVYCNSSFAVTQFLFGR